MSAYGVRQAEGWTVDANGHFIIRLNNTETLPVATTANETSRDVTLHKSDAALDEKQRPPRSSKDERPHTIIWCCSSLGRRKIFLSYAGHCIVRLSKEQLDSVKEYMDHYHPGESINTSSTCVLNSRAYAETYLFIASTHPWNEIVANETNHTQLKDAPAYLSSAWPFQSKHSLNIWGSAIWDRKLSIIHPGSEFTKQIHSPLHAPVTLCHYSVREFLRLKQRRGKFWKGWMEQGAFDGSRSLPPWNLTSGLYHRPEVNVKAKDIRSRIGLSWNAQLPKTHDLESISCKMPNDWEDDSLAVNPASLWSRETWKQLVTSTGPSFTLESLIRLFQHDATSVFDEELVHASSRVFVTASLPPDRITSLTWAIHRPMKSLFQVEPYSQSKHTNYISMRLLDISKTRLRLVEFEPRDPAAPYARLSHRWVQLDNPLLIKGTLEAFKSEIPLAILPKVLSEAIAITSLLRIRYLWIGALCIVQDDVEDWNQQIRNLSYIYQKTELVLVAADLPTAPRTHIQTLQPRQEGIQEGITTSLTDQSTSELEDWSHSTLMKPSPPHSSSSEAGSPESGFSPGNSTSTNFASSDDLESSSEDDELDGVIEFETHKRQISDSLMVHVYDMFTPVGTRTCKGSNSSSSSKTVNTSSNSTAPESAATGRKRSLPRTSSEGIDGEEAGDDSDAGKRRKTLESSKRPIPIERRRLACPYYKRNLQQCKPLGACAGPGWFDVHRLN